MFGWKANEKYAEDDKVLEILQMGGRGFVREKF